MRYAISGDRADLPLTRSESVARRTPSISAARATDRSSGSRMLQTITSPGCEGCFIFIARSSVVILNVQFRNGVALDSKGQPDVSANPHRPCASARTFELVQFPAGKAAHLGDCLSLLDGRQHGANLFRPFRGDAASIAGSP